MKSTCIAFTLVLSMGIYHCCSQSANKANFSPGISKESYRKLNKIIIDEALRELRAIKSEDGMTSYFDLRSPQQCNNNAVMFYINEFTENSFELRFRVHCMTNKTFTLNNECVLIADNRTFTIEGINEPTTNNVSNSFTNQVYSFGWFDTPATPEVIDAFSKLIKCEKPKIRCMGLNNFSIERTITSAEIDAFKKVINAYQIFMIKKLE